MLRSWLHKNAQQYVEATKSFMNSLPKGTLTRTRSNGDVIRYHETSNTFGVMTKDGTPRIMFKPGPLFIIHYSMDIGPIWSVSMSNNNDKMACRVCGLIQLDPTCGGDGKSPNYDICSCCGVEFGYENYSVKGVSTYRKKWLEGGSSRGNGAEKTDN